MRSKMDEVRNADCGELARESAAGDSSDRRREDDGGGIETEVWDKMVFMEEPED